MRRRDLDQPARPFDHHSSRLVERGPDQRHPAAPRHGQPMNPFGTSAGLAEAAPALHQPHPPAFAARRMLAVCGP
jgi:hypothetical protein